MSLPLVCTVVARNYLAYARVLATSLREHHPQARLVVLLLDAAADGAGASRDEPFETIAAEELGLPDLRPLAFRYSVLELGTALKPTLLLHLRSRFGCDRAIYLDPDILVLADLGELASRLECADLLLTPHLTAPIEDDAIPGEREHLVSGVYNLGFLALRYTPETLELLSWWERRLARGCRHAVEDGLFVDQKWMDLAPALLAKVEVLRDPGLNMAYWNLPHRRLERTGDGPWRVAGAPLRFFHFSGFDLDHPERISRFQNRYRLADRPDLVPLFAEYTRRLEEAGHRRERRTSYGYGRYSDASPVPDLARRLFAEVDPAGRRWPDPFDVAGPDPFRGWAESAGGGDLLPLPRLLLAAWDGREDLRVRFPRLDGADRTAFAAWALAHPASVPLTARAQAELAAALARATSDGRCDSGPVGRPADAPAGQEPRPGPELPPLVFDLLAARRDLRGRFADPRGADRRHLAIWLVTHGRLELDLPAAIWRPVRRSLSLKDAWWTRLWWLRRRARGARAAWGGRWAGGHAPAVAVRPTGSGQVAPPDPGAAGPGVNLVGWSSGTTGTAQVCREMAPALTAAGTPWVLHDLGGWRPGRGEAGGLDEQEGLPYEITLLHANADMTEEAMARLPRAAVAGRAHVGYWFWELAHFPLEFAPAFGPLTEVWAPTRFVAEAIRPLSPVPVRRVPPAVPTPSAPQADRAALGVDPGAFLFLFAFDARSVAERKNPLGLLAAFAEACRRAPRPLALLLKVQHLDPDAALSRELRRLAAALPVAILDEALDPVRMHGLYSAADAYVSLHRSEGLGLPLIETMLLGKPVVATGYGGVDDFLDERSGFVVSHRLVPLAERHGPYPPGALWAEPDLGRAAELMVAVAAGGSEVERRAAAGRERVMALYAPEAAGRRLRSELERLAREQAAVGIRR